MIKQLAVEEEHFEANNDHGDKPASDHYVYPSWMIKDRSGGANRRPHRRQSKSSK